MMRRRGGERGAALLIALGALALVSALAAAALSLASGPAVRATAAEERAKAVRVAEAAVHRLAAAMAQRELRAAAPLDGTVISTTFLGAEVSFSGQDAGGLIDLNAADEATLARLFAAAGPAADESEDGRIADAAESEEIARALAEARRSGTGRGGFVTPEAALAALPPALRATALPALAHATVWSGRAQVDPWTATAPAFAAAAGVPLPEARRFVAARLLEGRRAALPAGADFDGLAISDAAVARLTVRVETPGGGRAEVTAVLRAETSARAPITILAWR